MSQPTAEATERGWLTGLDRHGGPSLATALAGAALVPTAALTTVRLLRNAPGGLPAGLDAATPALVTAAAVVPALAFLGLALAAGHRSMRFVLLVLGVFPLLAAVDDAAWLPAAGATVAGVGCAVALELGRTLDVDSPGRLRRALAERPERIRGVGAVGLLGWLALACSLAGAAGLASLTVLELGATATFAALALLPVVRAVDGTAVAVWIAVTVGVVWWAITAPFVAGAVTLVAFGAGQAPFLLLAAGVGGAVATAFADACRRAWGPAVAALLLLFAGVPGRLPRAVTVALGLLVLAREWDAGEAAAGPATAETGTDAPAGGGTDA